MNSFIKVISMSIMESQEQHNNKLGLDVKTIYSEVCTNIRTTDEISFKLLGLVPFASGAGIIGISTLDKTSLIPEVRLLVALFAVTSVACRSDTANLTDLLHSNVPHFSIFYPIEICRSYVYFFVG